MTRLRFCLGVTLALTAACATPRRGLASVGDDAPTRFEGSYETLARRCGIAGDTSQITRDIIEIKARARANQPVTFTTAHASVEAISRAGLEITNRSFTLSETTPECARVVTRGRVEDDGRDAALVPQFRRGCTGPEVALEDASATPLSFSDEFMVEGRPGEPCPSDRVASRLWQRRAR